MIVYGLHNFFLQEINLFKDQLKRGEKNEAFAYLVRCPNLVSEKFSQSSRRLVVKERVFSYFFKGCLYTFLKQFFDCFNLRLMKNNFAVYYELQVNFCCISQLEVSTDLM